jgi:hypothetical protein
MASAGIALPKAALWLGCRQLLIIATIAAAGSDTVINVSELGAVGDGLTDNTAVFAAAIAACGSPTHSSPRCTVVVPRLSNGSRYVVRSWNLAADNLLVKLQGDVVAPPTLK